MGAEGPSRRYRLCGCHPAIHDTRLSVVFYILVAHHVRRLWERGSNENHTDAIRPADCCFLRGIGFYEDLKNARPYRPDFALALAILALALMDFGEPLKKVVPNRISLSKTARNRPWYSNGTFDRCSKRVPQAFSRTGVRTGKARLIPFAKETRSGPRMISGNGLDLASSESSIKRLVRLGLFNTT